MKAFSRILLFTLLGLLLACAQVRGSGAKKEELRTVPEFTEVEVSGGVRAEVSVGPLGPVRVTGDDNIVPFVETEVRAGRLRIGMKNGTSVQAAIPIQVTAAAPGVRVAQASSGSDLVVSGLAADDVGLKASSGATLKASGTAKRASIGASSGSTLRAGDLVCEDVTVAMSSGANSVVHATTSIDGSVESGAALTVRGGAKRRSVKLESGGGIGYE